MIWPVLPLPSGSVHEELSKLISNLFSEACPPGPLINPDGARAETRALLEKLRPHLSEARTLIAANVKPNSDDPMSKAIVQQQIWLLLQLAHELCDRIRRCDAAGALGVSRRMESILLDFLIWKESFVFGIHLPGDPTAEAVRDASVTRWRTPRG